MQQMFEHIPVDSVPFICTYQARSEQPDKGYYHWHQCCEILVIHEGEGTVTIGPQVMSMEAGTLFFFQPFQLHKVFAVPKPDKPYVRSIIHVNQTMAMSYLEHFPRHLNFFHRLCHGSKVRSSYRLGQQTALLFDLMAFHMRNEDHQQGARNEEHMTLLLQTLSILKTNDPSHSGSAPAYRELTYAEQIMFWIEHNYMHPFELEQLAEELHISKSYVSRIFRRETGSTITEYLLARRFKRACDLLEATSLSIDAIAGELSFNTTSHFISMFKKAYGITPLQFRKWRQDIATNHRLGRPLPNEGDRRP